MSFSCFDRIDGVYYNLTLLSACDVKKLNETHYTLNCYWNVNICNGHGSTHCHQTEERFQTREKAQEQMEKRMAKASSLLMRSLPPVHVNDDDFTPTKEDRARARKDVEEAAKPKNLQGIAAMIASGEKFTMSLEEAIVNKV
jgi:hypothetical protein